MVRYQDPVSLTFAALSDPTRRGVLSMLARGPATVGELADAHDQSVPGMLKHLRVLENASLLETMKNGRIRRCGIKPAPMRAAQRYLDGFSDLWERRFDSLERVVRKMEAEKR
jgi:DNA-binding transcriptional ArsR family regulator